MAPANDEAHLELLSSIDIATAPKRFRNPSWKPAQRRNRTIKQIISDATRKEASLMATQNNSGSSTPLAHGTGSTGTPNPAAGGTHSQHNILQAAQNLSKLVLEKNAMKDISSGPIATYTNIESAPSLQPAHQKRFCDITGLPTTYTDPKTRLRYYDKEIFAVIRNLTPSAIEGYLEARAAQAVLK
jgi:INO80 complex subunit C